MVWYGSMDFFMPQAFVSRMIDYRLRPLAGFALLAGLLLTCLPAPHAVAQPPAPEGEAEAPAEPSQMEGSFLLEPPETPSEYLQAAVQALDLARLDLARIYLERFWAQNPSDETLLQLRQEFGPVPFQRLANQDELQPLSIEIAERVTRLFRERGATPEQLSKLIDNLSDSPAEAYASRQALINTGPIAVPAILEQLRGGTGASIQRDLTGILVAMGPAVLPPLHAALESTENAVLVPVLHVIGRIGSRKSIPYLYRFAYGPATSPQLRQIARRTLAEIAETSAVSTRIVEPADASHRLRKTALDLLTSNRSTMDAAEISPSDDSPRTVAIWIWDPKANKLRTATIPRRQAQLRRATLLARDAFRIAPQRTQIQAFYLATRFEWEAAQAGTFEPPIGPETAFGVLLAAGPALARETLKEAVAAGLPRASVGALAVLSRVASPNLLFGGETALRDALNAPHPRVQLGAAVAILRLNPQRTFPEAERVVEILTRTLSDTGGQTAVIVDPNRRRAATLAGFVREMGYDAVIAASGQEGFRLATEKTAPAFILVNLNVSQWPLSQTLANFRADTRTKAVPLIVVGPQPGAWDVVVPEATSYTYLPTGAEHNPLNEVSQRLVGIAKTGYVTAATNSDAFFTQLAPILAAQLPAPLSDADRNRSREIAVYWMAQIADRGLTDRYPLAPAEEALAGAVFAPNLTNNALIALASIPTPSAQETIAMALLSGNLKQQGRLLAAEMLVNHIQHYGLLMKDDTAKRLARQPTAAPTAEMRLALTALSGLLHSRPADVPERLSQLPPIAPPAVAP